MFGNISFTPLSHELNLVTHVSEGFYSVTQSNNNTPEEKGCIKPLNTTIKYLVLNGHYSCVNNGIRTCQIESNRSYYNESTTLGIFGKRHAFQRLGGRVGGFDCRRLLLRGYGRRAVSAFPVF